MKFRHHRIAVGGDNRERLQHRATRPSEPFPQPGECHGLTVPASNGVWLLATLDGLPLIKYVGGNEASSLGERRPEHA
jgi:hypothetical protein